MYIIVRPDAENKADDGICGERIVLSGDKRRMLHNGPRNGDGRYARYPRDDKRV